jgi:indolepyruvate decarboxylase
MAQPLAQVLLQALQDHGAREIFGIPGDFALPFFAHVERQNALPLYTLSHEPAVGFAADAAARFNRAIGVAAVTYGAGAMNLVNAVAGAYAERSPVVVVSGAPGKADRASGFALHHQSRSLDSQLNVFREITCDQGVLDDPTRAPEVIARVLDSARRQSLPAYLELPRDMVDVPVGPVAPRPAPEVDPGALDECAREVLDKVRAARAPVIMAGVEVRRYALEAQVAELARRLNAPVVTSFLARGLFAQEPDVLAGTYLGKAGRAEVTQLVEQSDCLLLLGVIVSDTNFGVSAARVHLSSAVQALGGEVRIGHHSYAGLPLGALIDGLVQRVPAGDAAPAGQLVQPAAPSRSLPRDDAQLTSADVATAVNDLMAAHGPLDMTSDVGDCLFTAMEMETTRLAAPGYYAGMGFGVPAGLGVQATTGQRPLILVGDGAFQMTGWELGNCRRYGWDPIVLVFNNASWEMLRVFQPESRFNDLSDWNFAALAPALGGDGYRATTRAELARALDTAAATRGRFQLVEAMMPRGQTSDTLARFAGKG